MKKVTRLMVIFATSLVFIGGAVFTIAMTLNGWDFSKLNARDYVTKTYEITQEFSSIDVDVSTADVNIKLSTDGKCKVVTCEEEKIEYNPIVSNGVLKIRQQNNKKWYDYIAFVVGNSQITVYLTQFQLDSLNIKASTADVTINKEINFKNINVDLSTGDVKCYASAENQIKVKVSTGDIKLENLTTGSVDLKATTGDVELNNVTCQGQLKINSTTGDNKLNSVTCQSFISSASTGKLEMTNVIASQSFNIHRSTGDVKFNSCDASEITIVTDTGDVEGSFLSAKVFDVRTDTGNTSYPQSTSGGLCKITTDTGDVTIIIK